MDRLLKSPAKQRGKDFAVMLASLSDLGYAIEWRVINAAEYGFPQRRRRVFIVGYKQGTKLYENAKAHHNDSWLTSKGVLSDAFPVLPDINPSEFEIEGTYSEITADFSSDNPKISPFKNSGLVINRKVITGDVSPNYSGEITTLGDIIIDEAEVPEEFFISTNSLEQWKYLKGAKKEERKTSEGHVYFYSEGGMVYPDPLDKPSRTIITGEGGQSPSRFKHVVKTPSGRLRRLTPVELERLNMFPDNHTKLDGISDTKRAFFMGNALVVGAIQRVGESLSKKIS